MDRRRFRNPPAAIGRWLVHHWSSVWPVLGIVLIVALGAAFIYVVPGQLVHRDNASTPENLTKARHDERATLLQSLVGLLALFGAVSALRQLRVTREGQITDRYTKAIDQLDKDRALAVRLGGLYALERIARDSRADRATITEVLCAYARTTSRDLLNTSEVAPDREASESDREADSTSAAKLQALAVRAPDVQAAITILARWQARLRETPHVDLHGAELQRVDLRGAHLPEANFADAQLRGATLVDANLQEADFDDADLADADLRRAKLAKAGFVRAQLSRVQLHRADLRGAFLYDAELDEAVLFMADLYEARLMNAKLQRANLGSANMEKVALGNASLQEAEFVGTQLRGAYLAAAQLQGADLENAQLQGAELVAAELQGANFKGAQLQGTRFSDPRFSSARADSMTIWPDEFDWKAAGVELKEDSASSPDIEHDAP